jgi:hypothetical protein
MNKQRAQRQDGVQEQRHPMSGMTTNHAFAKRTLVACAILLCSHAAQAFEIDTPVDNLKLRWDNTLRYNLGWRVQAQDPVLLANASIDDGDRNFNRGLISNRLDLLSEFDAVYEHKYAIRFSGAGWYDYRLAQSLDNDSVATSNHLDSNHQPALGLSRAAQRQAHGPSAELLDAFVFARFDLGEVPLSIKVGRHTVFWGESLLLGGAAHSVSYGQAPIDLAKGLAVPGSEAKELFRPLNNVSLQMQPFDSLSIDAQYFLGWEPFRLPEAGTYLGFNDALQDGGESVILPTGGRALRAADITPRKQGNWGISTRWSPEFLDGTVGFYYRRTADMLPQVLVELRPDLIDVAECTKLPASLPVACKIPAQYRLDYPGGIDIYGLSLSKNIGGISFAAELSYRQNMPLSSEPLVLFRQPQLEPLQAPLNNLQDLVAQLGLPAGALPIPALPTISSQPLPRRGEAAGARGDTMHALVNGLGLINKVSLFGFTVFDSASYIVEAVWSRWNKVTENENLFKGRAGYTAIDRVTRDNYAIGASFAPTWFQVLPGVDLSLPLAYSAGLKGNSAVQFGGSEHGGFYTAGLSADVYDRYRIDLKYAEFFGEHSSDANGAATVLNGATAPLADRGFVSLTFKTTF